MTTKSRPISYTVEQVAALIGKNPETVRRWLRDGKLPGVRLGGTKAGWRVAADDVVRLLARRRHRPAV
jgi:excisionase family DNA binding protein